MSSYQISAPYFGHDGAALFMPTPADDLWASRASIRGVWSFTRVERLESLLHRSRQQETYLLRSRCDASGAVGLVLHDRWRVVRARNVKLATAARIARRAERDLQRNIHEWSALDAPRRGLISADLAGMIASASLVGHDS